MYFRPASWASEIAWESGFSPRTLAAELVVHPALNQAPAGECVAGSRLPEGDEGHHEQ